MANDAFIMKYGDTIPPLESVLIDGAGHNVDLTLATSVTLHIRPSITGGTPLTFVGAVAPPEDGPEPFSCIARYSWSGPQLLPIGIYYGEWEVLWDDGNIETFPNDGYFLLKITPELA